MLSILHSSKEEMTLIDWIVSEGRVFKDAFDTELRVISVKNSRVHYLTQYDDFLRDAPISTFQKWLNKGSKIKHGFHSKGEVMEL